METDFKVCPECGKSLKGQNLFAHSLLHFPQYLDPAKSSKLAIKRQAQIIGGGVTREVYIKEHEED